MNEGDRECPSWLVWLTKDKNFGFDALEHHSICRAIDEMNEGDLGTGSIYSVIGHNFGATIHLMTPRSARTHERFYQSLGIEHGIGPQTNLGLIETVRSILKISYFDCPEEIRSHFIAEFEAKAAGKEAKPDPVESGERGSE